MAEHAPALSPQEAQQLAEDAAQAMWSRDHVAQAMGMAEETPIKSMIGARGNPTRHPKRIRGRYRATSPET